MQPHPKGGCGGGGGGGSGTGCVCAIINEHQVVPMGCAPGVKISAITFASFGTPSGTCDGGVNPASRTYLAWLLTNFDITRRLT
jgi:hypothetical protein